MIASNIIKTVAIAGLIATSAFVSCNNNKVASTKTVKNTDTVKLKFTVEEAPEWNAIFKRQHGWFGADGIFAIPFSGVDTTSGDNDSTLLVFSDTMLGDIVNGKLQPGFKMIHNSVAYMKGTTPGEQSIRFVWDSTKGNAESVFIPG